MLMSPRTTVAGFEAARPCECYLCTQRRISTGVRENRLLRRIVVYTLFLEKRHQSCAAPLVCLEAFRVPVQQSCQVFPPVETRPPIFLRPGGTTPVVRLPVCYF